MITNIFSHIKAKRQRQQEEQRLEEERQRKENLERQKKLAKHIEEEKRLNKLYPRDYLFYGFTKEEVTEGDISFRYYHRDIFLADDTISPTSLKMLTGDNPVEIIIPANKRQYSRIIITYNDKKYDIRIDHDNSLHSDKNSFISLREIIKNTNWLNNFNRNYELREAKEKQQTNQIIADEFFRK